MKISQVLRKHFGDTSDMLFIHDDYAGINFLHTSEGIVALRIYTHDSTIVWSNEFSDPKELDKFLIDFSDPKNFDKFLSELKKEEHEN